MAAVEKGLCFGQVSTNKQNNNNKKKTPPNHMLLATEAYNTKKRYKLNEKYVPLCILYLLND